MVFTVLTGVASIPLAVTGRRAAVLFPGRPRVAADAVDGEVVGSTLIAQNFTRPEYFHPRPSARRRLRRVGVDRLELRADEPEARSTA